MRPNKKGHYFILVEESGKIHETNLERKTWKNTPENSGKKLPQKKVLEAKSLFPTKAGMANEFET